MKKKLLLITLSYITVPVLTMFGLGIILGTIAYNYGSPSWVISNTIFVLTTAGLVLGVVLAVTKPIHKWKRQHYDETMRQNNLIIEENQEIKTPINPIQELPPLPEPPKPPQKKVLELEIFNLEPPEKPSLSPTINLDVSTTRLKTTPETIKTVVSDTPEQTAKTISEVKNDEQTKKTIPDW